MKTVDIAVLFTGAGQKIALQGRNKEFFVDSEKGIVTYTTYEEAEAAFHELARIHVNQYWD